MPPACGCGLFQSTLPTRGSDLAALVLGVRVWAFQSTLPTRGSDAVATVAEAAKKCFNPRSPRGGATPCGFYKLSIIIVSIHAPHEGERHRPPKSRPCARYMFQSTLPTRGSDLPQMTRTHTRRLFQSTLPTRGSDIVLIAQGIKAVRVSIHAPHEGERPYHSGLYGFSAAVSIHAPHEGERPNGAYDAIARDRFQSTLPTRGSDRVACGQLRTGWGFNPRSPRGGATNFLHGG